MSKDFGRTLMIDTPVVLSPFSMAYIIGAAPLHRGSKLACTLIMPLQRNIFANKRGHLIRKKITVGMPK